VASRRFEVCFGVVSGPELLRLSVSRFDPKLTCLLCSWNVPNSLFAHICRWALACFRAQWP